MIADQTISLPVRITFITLLIISLSLGCGKKEAAHAPVGQSHAEVIEKAIRKELKKPTGELTKADYEKVTRLILYNKQLTEVPKGLEKLTKLERLHLETNQLTDVTGLEKLTELTRLNLASNQLTKLPEGLEKLTQ
ncbi:uncharacterized protein METZ01_LOCUS304058, partial [marine metagenome]